MKIGIYCKVCTPTFFHERRVNKQHLRLKCTLRREKTEGGILSDQFELQVIYVYHKDNWTLLQSLHAYSSSKDWGKKQ